MEPVRSATPVWDPRSPDMVRTPKEEALGTRARKAANAYRIQSEVPRSGAPSAAKPAFDAGCGQGREEDATAWKWGPEGKGAPAGLRVPSQRVQELHGLGRSTGNMSPLSRFVDAEIVKETLVSRPILRPYFETKETK